MARECPTTRVPASTRDFHGGLDGEILLFVIPMFRGSQRAVFSLIVLLCSCTPAHHSALGNQAEEDLRNLVKQFTDESHSLFLPPTLLKLIPATHRCALPTCEESLRALLDPASFESLRRAYHFDSVFLPTGQSCSALRDHLINSPLWVLMDIVPEGYLFGPIGNPEWKLSEIARGDSRPKDSSDIGESSLILQRIRIAENLISIGKTSEAESLLSISAGSQSEEARRLAALASMEAARGHWEKSLDLSRQSLRLDPMARSARIILIRALTESGHVDEALREAKKLADQDADAETLFLLARVANSHGDHREEINALQQLVETGKRTRQPVGASLLYLGQALGHEGRQGEALRALDEAAQCPELTAEQITLIRELRDHLAPLPAEP